MWHQTRTGALRAALRDVRREVDPDILIEKAKAAGVRLPIEFSPLVSAPSLGEQPKPAFQVEHHRLPELRAAVDKLMSSKAA